MIRMRFMVAGVAAAVVACNGSSTTGATTGGSVLVSADVARAAADGTAEDVDVMAGMDGSLGHVSATMNLGTTTGGIVLDAGQDGDGRNRFRPGLLGCLFTGGSFRCPTEDNDGLQVTRTVTFLAANGSTQAAFDSLLTASIHVVVDVTGDRTDDDFTATVTRHRDITITGLLGSETTRTVNGTGTEKVSKSRVSEKDGTVRAFTLDGSFTIADVVLPVRMTDGGNGFPLSGTITRQVTITETAGPDAGKTFTRTVVITFNGTATVTATVNGTPFTFDLVGRTERERD